MKYQKKLTLLLVFSAILSNLLAVFILYTRAEKLIFSEIQSRVVSIAATTASLVGGKKWEDLTTLGKEPEKSFQAKLEKILSSHQKKGLEISSVYLFEKKEKRPSEVIFLIENEEKKRKKLHFPPKEDLEKFGQYSVTKEYFQDNEGAWLIGYAPIQDLSGQTVANIGVDIISSKVHHDLDRIVLFSGLAFAVSIALALLLSMILSKRFSSPLHHICATIDSIGKENVHVTQEKENQDEFGLLSSEITKMSKGLEQREKLMKSFSRYVSRHILEKILDSDEMAHLEGERKKVTILVSDLREFTRMAEKLPSESVVHLLNEYFSKMIEIIFKYHGTLDKLLGDGMMVIFGAPLDDPSQEEHATLAALEMQKTLQELSKKWQAEGKMSLTMGVGIHTGEAIVGNIGTEKRLEYTAVGDTVNIAFKIEQETKNLGASILVSAPIYEAVKDKVAGKSLGEFTIRGREGKVKLFSIESLC